MKCPHCTIDFHDNEKHAHIGRDQEGDYFVGIQRCSACRRLVLRLISATDRNPNSGTAQGVKDSYLIRPKVAGRAPIPADVPQKYTEDYNDACLVLADSAKASAALSRRCLQLPSSRRSKGETKQPIRRDPGIVE